VLSLANRKTPFLHSLRARALGVVFAVVFAPVAFVWVSDSMDSRTRDKMMENVESAALAAADLSSGDRIAVAIDHGVWLRTVDGDGVTTLEVDAETPTTLVSKAGAFFFGPDGAPSLQEWDRAQLALQDRAEVLEAWDYLTVATCEESEGQKLLVCWAAAPSEDGVVHVQESSRRAIRALYDVRYQVLKLALIVGLTGLALGAWLGGRIVRPIEQLRDALRERVTSDSPTAPIGWKRSDELGELSRDIDHLLSTLAGYHERLSERSAAVEERNTALAERNSALAELNAAVEERNAALAERAADVAAHAKATEAFVSDLTHEFKNPVAAIRAAAESIGSGRPIDDERAARLARILDDSSGRLDVLLTQLLELARLEATLATEAREPVRLDTLLNALVDVLRDRHEYMLLSVDAAPAVVEAAPARLEAALRNILENAAAFAGPEDPEAWVGIAMRLEDEGEAPQVIVSISDSGPGITSEDLPRVFDRFFTTRPSQGGTGLGLALTKAVIAAHGGSIEAASPPAGGAVVTFRLPRIADSIPEVEGA